MRRLAVLIAVTAALLLSGCGGSSPRNARLWLTHPQHRLFTACVSADCGPWQITLNWLLPPFPGTTGYYTFLNGAQQADVSSGPFTYTGSDCGTAVTLGVEAHNGSGQRSPLYTISYTTPACAVTQVGAPSPSGVVCSSSVNPTGSNSTDSTNVTNALTGAAVGSTVCMNSGTWGAVTLTSVAPGSCCVTLAATPGQTVVVPGFTLTGSNTQNLTVEGFSITTAATSQTQGGAADNGIQLLCGISGGVTFKYDTIENQPNGNGIYVNAANCSPNTATQTGVSFLYDQIDNVATGVEIDGGRTQESTFTISHNVIGPNLLAGTSGAPYHPERGHYIQVQGIAGFTVDNNAFEGPATSNLNCAADGSQSHLNVLHVDAGETGVTFDNNVIWHAQTCGDAVLIQNQPLDTIEAKNNLDVEDPGCATLTPNPCDSTFALIEAPHTLTFSSNTIAGALRGTVLGQVATGDSTYTDPNGMTAQDDVAVGVAESGHSNYDLWTCNTTCATGSNASQDTSVTSVMGASGNVASWTPSWTTTSWTPVNGPGYQPPPTGYYQPVGLGITGAGYQGSVGP